MYTRIYIQCRELFLVLYLFKYFSECLLSEGIIKQRRLDTKGVGRNGASVKSSFAVTP